MYTFWENEVTTYESTIIVKVINSLKSHGKTDPTIDDILHELIRLSDIAIKNIPNYAE